MLEHQEETAADPQQAVRVDRWLWAARMFKTRSLAAKACTAGHVKVNGVSAKAGKLVRAGDRIDALTPAGPRILEVKGLADKRGSAEIARALYEDHSPPPPPRDPSEGVFQRDRGAGRPTKRDRRVLSRIRGR